MNTFDDIRRSSSIDEETIAPSVQRYPRPGKLVRFPDPIFYPDAWALQQRLHAERLRGNHPDVLLLLEHQPVYTLGRRTQPAHLGKGEQALHRTGASIQPVNRGGSITYHGPGQLVGYPILQLSHYAAGPKAYVRLLENVLIDTLALWGIKGYRIDKNPGVWVQSDHGKSKIASIGVRVDQGITLHGFALNVDLDLAPFSHIVPCGLAQCRTTSLRELCHASVSFDLVTEQVAGIFSAAFNIAWINPVDEFMKSNPADCRQTSLTMKGA